MADTRPLRTASAPDSLIKKVSDRYPYGGVRSEPLKNANPDIDDPKPRPTPRRRRPRARAEHPYPEPRAKNQPPAHD